MSTAKFREDLINIAMTTLSSKILNVDKRYFATLAVDAVLRLKVGTLGGTLARPDFACAGKH